MPSVYIRDKLIPSTGHENAAKRSKDDINITLTAIVPRPTTSIQQTKLGFMVTYPQDSDVNLFLKPENITKLLANNLSASLAHNTRDQRIIYIINSPQQTYDKIDAHLCVELEHQNDINILKLDKFISSETNKRYIKLILDSKESTDTLAKKGKVSLFGVNLPALAKFSDQNKQEHQRPNRINARTGYANNPGFHAPVFTTNAQTLPSNSNWGVPGTRTSHHPNSPLPTKQDSSKPLPALQLGRVMRLQQTLTFS